MGVETGRRLEIPYPSADELALRIRSGACRLALHREAGEAWLSVAGEGDSAPALRVEERGGELTLGVAYDEGAVPRLDVGVGTRRRFELQVESFSSGSVFELGGVPLSRVEMRLSGGPTTVSFDAPNPVAMSRLHIDVSSGQLEGKGLCRAGFTELLIDGGQPSLRLDLSGDLLYEATVRVATSGGSTWILVPESVPAEVSGHGLFGTPRVQGHFTRIADLYLNQAALNGGRPLLRVQNGMAMGTFLVVSG